MTSPASPLQIQPSEFTPKVCAVRQMLKSPSVNPDAILSGNQDYRRYTKCHPKSKRINSLTRVFQHGT